MYQENSTKKMHSIEMPHIPLDISSLGERAELYLVPSLNLLAVENKEIEKAKKILKRVELDYLLSNKHHDCNGYTIFNINDAKPQDLGFLRSMSGNPKDDGEVDSLNAIGSNRSKKHTNYQR